MKLSIEGLKPKEAGMIRDTLDRLGFIIEEFIDEDLQACRPEVLALPEFKQAAASADTGYYATVVWSRLLRLSTARNPGVRSLAPPVQFMTNSHNTHRPLFQNLLVVSTLPPMVDWMEDRREELNDYFGVNPRMIYVARTVSEATSAR